MAASARPGDKLDEAVAPFGDKAQAFAFDLADHDAAGPTVAAIEERMGPIALAVLNAGVYLPTRAEKPEFDAFKRTFDINLLGTAACLTALSPRQCARRRGQIAIVSSATGFGGFPTAAAYGASKAALINMAGCFAIELDRWGVLVQAVTPGFVETPAQDDNTFPKPFIVTPEKAAQKIDAGLRRKTYEITFPKVFTQSLQMLFALPRNMHIPQLRKQTGWNKPVPDDAMPGDEAADPTKTD